MKTDASTRESVSLIALCVVIITFIFLVGSISYFNTSKEGSQFDLSNCVDKYSPLPKAGEKSAEKDEKLLLFCNSYSLYHYATEESKIRIDDLIYHRRANEILLIMVVGITTGGVVLAGLQLLGSYNIASRHKLTNMDVGAKLFDGDATTLNYSKDNISFKSSVVGVAILAISFAFFLVYVLYVYKLEDSVAKTNYRGPVTPFIPDTPVEDKPAPQPPHSPSPSPGEATPH